MSPHRATTLSHLHAALPDLAAEARARALEFEDVRRLPADFADKLKRAGASPPTSPPTNSRGAYAAASTA
jgi:hypothetical protein